MKKIIFALLSSVVMVSCGGGDSASDAVATPKQDTIVPSVCVYSYDPAATEIGFGAFKTTAKKEVKGSFLNFEVWNTQSSDTLLNVFSNAKFFINIEGLSTGDLGRDQKIKESFFGSMDSTVAIIGGVKSFDTDSSKVLLLFKLNNIEKELVLNYVITDDVIELKGSLNLLDFKAQKAVDALNKACKDLHKGEDGISKTWADVNIYLKTILKNSCK